MDETDRLLLRGRLPHGRLVHAMRRESRYDWRTLCALGAVAIRPSEEEIDCPSCLARIRGMRPRVVP